LAGYATRTNKILLGTDILVLPFYNPVRIAEDTAMVDVMSQARFIFGAAIGYRPQEFQLFGVDMDNRGARYVEQLKIIRALWTQDDVSFEGRFYHLTGAKIEPKPLSQPHPPIWLGGWGDLSIKRAAELGNVWVPGPTANLEKLLTAQAKYRSDLAAAGKPAQTEWPLTREFIIADTDEMAFDLAEKYLLINYRDEYGGGWEHPLIGKQDAAPVNQLESLSQNRFIIGDPDRCIKSIQQFVEMFGMNHLICRLYFPGMPHEHIMRELELISREVMPAFA
jgi:alkanesulfonate monooxygenase SsuD/methylene tetrahydromethanopterin reductase-like flavin-dependent oxidoreductase (luciferase family)